MKRSDNSYTTKNSISLSVNLLCAGKQKVVGEPQFLSTLAETLEYWDVEMGSVCCVLTDKNTDF